MKYGLQGPNETICTACAAGTHAIGYAARLIAWGRCDAVATGGSECAATLTSLAGFGNMTALSSTGASKPFDTTRDGFVMGEGAAVFILERYDLAVARGATILGEILGSASNADAHHITAPAPGGTTPPADPNATPTPGAPTPANLGQDHGLGKQSNGEFITPGQKFDTETGKPLEAPATEPAASTPPASTTALTTPPAGGKMTAAQQAALKAKLQGQRQAGKTTASQTGSGFSDYVKGGGGSTMAGADAQGNPIFKQNVARESVEFHSKFLGIII
jgi:3-oxoacyl-(acyl-carrier-protein) synthase